MVQEEYDFVYLTYHFLNNIVFIVLTDSSSLYIALQLAERRHLSKPFYTLSSNYFFGVLLYVNQHQQLDVKPQQRHQ